MKRDSFRHDGLTFSYLDSGGDKPVLLLLHGHFMGASDFEGIAPAFTDRWRVVALDQRGHGETDHTKHHSIDAYIGDVAALLDHLWISDPVVVLGHSWGGAVAYLCAAAQARRFRAMIIEEMNVVRDDHDDFALAWAGVYADKAQLEAKIGPRLTPYMQKSIRQVEGGWSMTFDPAEILWSEAELNGDHWREWLASTCPALIVKGAHSPVIPGAELDEMARRRANTRIVTIDAGHSVHIDQPGAFTAAVKDFLGGL